MFPVSPSDGGREQRPEKPEYRTKVRNDLKHRRQNCPNRSKTNMEKIEPDQPKNSDCQRVLCLGDSPVLQGAASDAEVIRKFHVGTLSITFFELPATRTRLAAQALFTNTSTAMPPSTPSPALSSLGNSNSESPTASPETKSPSGSRNSAAGTSCIRRSTGSAAHTVP